MSWNRRDFLFKASLGAVSLPLVGGWTAHAATLNKGNFSVLQGLTDHRSSQFAIVRPKNQIVEYFFSEVDSMRNPVGAAWRPHSDLRLERNDSSLSLDKIAVVGLRLGTEYCLEIRNPQGAALERRFFKALDLSRDSIKFAQVSCMHDALGSVQADMWPSLISKDPDLIFFVGDSCYADSGGVADEKQLWRRFCETRTTLDIFYSVTLKPILATWDDHDYGINNGDFTYAHKNVSLQNFKNFFAQDLGLVPEYTNGPANSSWLQAWGMNFFFMDDRFFRTSRNSNLTQAHWGEEQEEWLLDNMASRPNPTFILNGSQFFGGYLQKDSFEYVHPQNFQYVLSELKKQKAEVIFGSGDIHYSEVMKIESAVLGYETLEIVSSGIHSFLVPFRGNKKNPRRIHGENEYNYSIVEAQRQISGVAIKVSAYTTRNKLLYQHQTTVKR